MLGRRDLWQTMVALELRIGTLTRRVDHAFYPDMDARPMKVSEDAFSKAQTIFRALLIKLTDCMRSGGITIAIGLSPPR